MYIVVGDDELDYEFDTVPPDASLLETKILINSVIYDARRGSRFMSLSQRSLPSVSNA